MNWLNFKKNANKNEEYTYLYDCIKEAELKYWETKSKLCDEVQKYINEVSPTSSLRGYAIVEECEKYNIDIKFVLAQGEIESHFGTKGIGGKLNNVFNIGVFDGLTSDTVNSIYKYNYPNQSIRPYLELLQKKYLVNKLEVDLLHKFVDIDGNRYASDVNYEEKLTYKYNYIKDNTNIECLYLEMKSYALKCNR